MTGRAYAVAGGKGGVGKTTTVVNLGVMLRVAGHRVAVVDADLGMANVATVLGIDHQPTVHDVLAGDANTLEAVVEEPDGFGVVPGSTSLDGFAAADPEDLEQVIETLIADFDVVLVDTGAGLSFESVLPVGMTDGVLLVSTPDRAAIEDTAKTAEIVELAEGTVLGAVLTRVRDGDDLDIYGIADRLGTDVLEVIPEDPAVQASIDDQKPLITLDPESPAATAYRSLGKTLLERVEGASDADNAGVGTDPPPDRTAISDPKTAESEDSHDHGPEDSQDHERAPNRETGSEDPAGDTASQPETSPSIDESVSEGEIGRDHQDEDESPIPGYEADDLDGSPAEESGDASADVQGTVAPEGQAEPAQGDALDDVDGTDLADGPSSSDPADDAGDDLLDPGVDQDTDRSETDQDRARDGAYDDGPAVADEPLGGLAEGSIGSSPSEDGEDFLETDEPADSTEETPVEAGQAGPPDDGAMAGDRSTDPEDEPEPEDTIDPLDLDTDTDPGESSNDLDANDESEEPPPSAGSDAGPVAAPEPDPVNGEPAEAGEAVDDTGREPKSDADLDAVVDAARGAAAVSDELDDPSAGKTETDSTVDSTAVDVADDDMVGNGEDGHEGGDGEDDIGPTGTDRPADPEGPAGSDTPPDPTGESADSQFHDAGAADEERPDAEAEDDDPTLDPSGDAVEDEATTDESAEDQPIGGSTAEATDADVADDADEASEGGISIPEAPSAADETKDADESIQQEGEQEAESDESRGFLSRLLNPFG